MNTIFSFSTGLKARSMLTFSSLILGAAALVFAVVKPTVVSMVSAATPTACIITVFGVQYDVTALGTMHSGPQGTTLDAGAGGFFQCGTDMSTAYQAQHGTNVSRLASFAYVAPTVTPTTAPNNTPTPTPTSALDTIPTVSLTPTPTVTSGGSNQKDDDDNDLEEHEIENESDDDSREESDKESEYNNKNKSRDYVRGFESSEESED